MKKERIGIFMCKTRRTVKKTTSYNINGTQLFYKTYEEARLTCAQFNARSDLEDLINSSEHQCLSGLAIDPEYSDKVLRILNRFKQDLVREEGHQLETIATMNMEE